MGLFQRKPKRQLSDNPWTQARWDAQNKDLFNQAPALLVDSADEILAGGDARLAAALCERAHDLQHTCAYPTGIRPLRPVAYHPRLHDVASRAILRCEEAYDSSLDRGTICNMAELQWGWIDRDGPKMWEFKSEVEFMAGWLGYSAFWLETTIRTFENHGLEQRAAKFASIAETMCRATLELPSPVTVPDLGHAAMLRLSKRAAFMVGQLPIEAGLLPVPSGPSRDLISGPEWAGWVRALR